MATGRLGTLDVAAATYENLYVVPADTFTVASVSLVNRTTGNVTLRLAVTTVAAPGAPTNPEFIEYDVVLAPKGVLERTGLVLDAGKIIKVYASGVGVSAVAMGIETSTVTA
jgi:hypothetical protein